MTMWLCSPILLMWRVTLIDLLKLTLLPGINPPWSNITIFFDVLLNQFAGVLLNSFASMLIKNIGLQFFSHSAFAGFGIRVMLAS